MYVDWDNLRLTLQPHAWRGGVVLQGLMKAMFTPLKTLYKGFARYVAKEEQERSYDSTVKQLRQAVADHLGIAVTAVAYSDVADHDYVEVHRASDGLPNLVGLGNVAVWSSDMIQWNREFVVTLPTAYRGHEAEVRAVLDRYKMAASRYSIEYV